MNTYDNISKELRDFFSNQSIFKILLPLDIIIMFGATGLYFISNWVDFGGLAYILIYYFRLLGYLLTYANRKDQMLAIGFFGYAGIEAIDVIRYLLFHGYPFLSWSSLVNAIVFGFLGYCILKKSYKVENN